MAHGRVTVKVICWNDNCRGDDWWSDETTHEAMYRHHVKATARQHNMSRAFHNKRYYAAPYINNISYQAEIVQCIISSSFIRPITDIHRAWALAQADTDMKVQVFIYVMFLYRYYREA